MESKQIFSNKSTTLTNTDVSTSLELETTLHESKANLRGKMFHKILSNEVVELSLTKFVFSVLVTILVSTASTFAFTLIPFHNMILYPSYWYEFLYLYPIWSIWAAIFFTYITGCYMNIAYIKGFRCILIMWLILALTSVVFIISIYCLWTYALHFRFPIPWVSFIVGDVMVCVGLAIFWFTFPREWRKNKIFQRRLKFGICLQLYNSVTIIQYKFVSILVIRYQNMYQPNHCAIICCYKGSKFLDL